MSVDELFRLVLRKEDRRVYPFPRTFAACIMLAATFQSSRRHVLAMAAQSFRIWSMTCNSQEIVDTVTRCLLSNSNGLWRVFLHYRDSFACLGEC